VPDDPITLEEYETEEFNEADIPVEIGEEIWEEYGDKIDIEFPTRKTGGKWRLTNQGYGGRVRLDEEWSFVFEPKTSVRTILGMLEYAYDLDSLEILEGLYDADSLADYFDEIASTLAKSVMRRQRQGLHKNYVEKEEQTAAVKGRIDFNKTARRPWEAKPHVKYREMTVDIEDNQILLWTLQKVLTSDVPSESTLQSVRRAYRSMASEVSLERFRASDCVGREYRRLNQDYEQLHALCHLILDAAAPTRSPGDRRMIPFIVDMETLYERFVANWLDDHLEPPYSVSAQEEVPIGDSGRDYEIDLVIYRDGKAVTIADTKYKVPSQPATDDISQVISYAEAKSVERAYLVYPESLTNPINTRVGDVDVGTLAFRLGDDLDDEGNDFLAELSSALGLRLSSAVPVP